MTKSQQLHRVSIMTLALILCLIIQVYSQPLDATKVHIQSRKYSVISGQQAQTKVTPQRVNHSVPYARAFTRKPDVGLSVYNLQFDYNPIFSINVLQESSTTSNFQFYITGRPSQSNIYNQLFIMYIASDYDQLGIYMPGPKNTTAKIGVSTVAGQKFEDLTFNFKNVGNLPIFPNATKSSDIKVSVYLTGIQALSQTVENGYEKNYAYFSLSIPSYNSRVYTVRVKVRSFYGQVLIKIIQFTVVYFDITKISAQYQMNSNLIVSSNFGGTFFKSSYSAPLQPLPQDNNFDNTLQYFFGISEIECSEGQTINLLAVQRFNYNNNGKLQNLVLTFQTQRNTLISRGTYHYIQYKPRNCNDPKSCGVPCDKTTQAVFRISNSQNLCYLCQYFCASCTNSTRCDTCPSTRIMASNGICICKNNSYFQKVDKNQCQDCFDVSYCQTCEREGVCLTCFDNFLFNNAKRVCQCGPGTYDSIEKKNQTGLFKKIDLICQKCPPQCVYCRNSSSCESCTVPTYLATKPATVKQVLQTCFPICSSFQEFNTFTKVCQSHKGDTSLFDSVGRLGFDWTSKNVKNDLVVDLVFSQANMSYYFYENGKGYQYVKTTVEQEKRNDAGTSSLYYDDGNGFIRGYSGAGATSFESSVINTKITQQTNGYMFDESALQGQYYGMGQAKFFKQRYQELNPQATYLDQFGIPFGKHQLKSTTISEAATFLDSIRNNLDFKIGGQSVPYTIRALSGNHFQLTVRPQKSYLTSNASISFKNPALIRSGQTALQTPIVSKQLDRLDYYTQSQLATATSLRDRTSTIVQILWGICKYILFIGFGWAVMPLMLILQYIFGHNYITSQLPLNLKYFLTSFADFRNPSILFNPLRNQFDRQVVNHGEIYKRVGAYEQFDRGIDFMKNSFQFFFVPLLSFGLQFIFIGINFLTTKVCKRQIPIVSRYLQPRLGLHAAAYTLVQALPISFFFFGQLQDTRYNHVNSPNSIYPSFNTGMSYASFFASIAIPLVLLAGIYNYFKNKARSGNFDFNKVKGVGNDESSPASKDPAMIGDPLWGGNPYKPQSYGFGGAIFALPLLAGFVLSFFTRSYPWQLTGLLLGNLGVTSYAAASNHFDSKIPKFFHVGIGALMTGYELVHAGIGSNRALSTFDQWNTGYLGIGIIYALLLVGVIFSGYLIYKLLSSLYSNIIKPYGCFSKLKDEQKAEAVIQSPEADRGDIRFNTMQRKNRREKTQLKSYLQTKQPAASDQRLNLKNDNREQQMAILGGLNNQTLFRQQLEYLSANANGSGKFRAQQSRKQYNFPYWSTQILMQNLPLLIDSNQKIFRKKDQGLLGTVAQYMRKNTDSQSSDSNNAMVANNRKKDQQQQQEEYGYQKSNKKLNQQSNNVQINRSNKSNQLNSLKFIKIGGQPYQYQQNQKDETFVLKNFNGKPQVKISMQQFFDQFIANKNVFQHNGEQYLLGKQNNQEEDQQMFFVQNTNSGQVQKIQVEQILQLLRNQKYQDENQYNVNLFTPSHHLQTNYNQASNQGLGVNNRGLGMSNQAFGMSSQALGMVSQAFGASNQALGATNQAFGASYQGLGYNNQGRIQVSNQGQGILSTSLLPSRNQIGQFKDYVQYQPSSSNKSIMFTKQTQQYLINGKTYEKVSQNLDFIFLRNTDTGEKISVRKNDVRIRGIMSTQKIGSIKQLAQKKLREQPQIMLNSQRYRYNGMQNGKYSFYSAQKNNYIELTLEQLAQYYGFERIGNAERSFVQVQTTFNPSNAKKLSISRQTQTHYYFSDPYSNQQYQIEKQTIDINYPLYLDENDKIWHKGQILNAESSVVEQKEYRVRSHTSLPSSQSFSLKDYITSNNYYKINFLSPDYRHSENKLPSPHEIIESKDEVGGNNVLAVIDDMKRRNPYGKIFIQNLNQPSEKFIME